jgi:hypothetical protein
MRFGKTVEERRAYYKWYRETHREKCREIQRKYYERHKDEINRRKREKRKTPEYREHARGYARERYIRLKELIASQKANRKLKHRLTWNNGTAVTKENWQRAERIALKILEQEGYDEIIKVETNFPFDYLCKKDGRKYAVEVTTDWQREIRPHKIKLLRFANWRLLFLFIKPDFTQYRLIEIKRLTYRWVNVFMEQYPEPFKKLSRAIANSV